MQPWSQPLLWKGAGASCAWNPSDKTANVTLSGGNLTATVSTVAGDNGVRSTNFHTNGKYYGEFAISNGAVASSDTGVGIALSSAVLGSVGANPVNAFLCYVSGHIYFNGTYSFTNINNTVNNDIVGMAIDLDHKTGWFNLNGTLWNNGSGNDPAANIGGVDISSLFPGTGAYAICTPAYNAAPPPIITAHFSSGSFTYSPPSGFSPWCP